MLRSKIFLVAGLLTCAAANASVDLDQILLSKDFQATFDAGQRSIVRVQVVTDASDVIHGSFDSAWLRVTHTGIANNSLSKIMLTVQFPSSAVGKKVLVQGGTRFETVPSGGKMTLTIPSLDRGFTAEIQIPKPGKDGPPVVQGLTASGFSSLQMIDGPNAY
jgi:hypothetical protein